MSNFFCIRVSPHSKTELIHDGQFFNLAPYARILVARFPQHFNLAINSQFGSPGGCVFAGEKQAITGFPAKKTAQKKSSIFYVRIRPGAAIDVHQQKDPSRGTQTASSASAAINADKSLIARELGEQVSLLEEMEEETQKKSQQALPGKGRSHDEELSQQRYNLQDFEPQNAFGALTHHLCWLQSVHFRASRHS